MQEFHMLRQHRFPPQNGHLHIGQLQTQLTR